MIISNSKGSYKWVNMIEDRMTIKAYQLIGYTDKITYPIWARDMEIEDNIWFELCGDRTVMWIKTIDVIRQVEYSDVILVDIENMIVLDVMRYEDCNRDIDDTIY